MNEDQLDDLKQFIASTVSQTETRLVGRLENLEQKVGSLELKVDDGFAGISEAIEQINEQHADIDQRLTKLEPQSA